MACSEGLVLSGEGRSVDQPTYGRMGLWTTRKGNISRMKNASIESSGRKLRQSHKHKQLQPERQQKVRGRNETVRVQ
jgi:hypothetical protein